MKLPALGITTAFALGIACGLNPEITHRSSSQAFVALLLFSAAASLLIGCFRGSLATHCRGAGLAVVLGNARDGRGLHRGTTEASGSYLEPGGLREN
jgi:hypothetical protein